MKQKLVFAILLLTFTINCGKPLTIYKHPDLPESYLSNIEAISISPLICGVTLYENPITCQNMIVRKFEGNIGITGVAQYEKLLLKSEIGKPFSIKFHSTTGWFAGQVSDCISIITFVPRQKQYRIIYNTITDNKTISKCGVLVEESVNEKWIKVDDNLIAHRKFHQPFASDGPWASPLSEAEMARIGIK